MKAVSEYRDYIIVETDWTTSVNVGGVEEVRPVYVIPGLKERPSRPFLTTVDEAREYIDAELDGREAWKEESSEEFEAVLKVRGAASVGLTVPADVARRMGLDVGDRVVVTIRKA